MQSVRHETTQANKKYSPISSNLEVVMRDVVTTRTTKKESKTIDSRNAKGDTDKWRQEACNHFQTVLRNLEYLRDRNFPPALKRQLRQAYRDIIKL